MVSRQSRVNKEMAILSLDFLVGFAIFMATFITVMTMCSGLLINLQSRTVDLDAVAYRTSVILAEDTGSWMASDVHWEEQFYSNEDKWANPFLGYSTEVKDNIRRLGLLGAADGGSGNYYLYDPASSSVALGPENITYSPLVLSERKCELFFNKGINGGQYPYDGLNFSYEDIRTKTIFPPNISSLTGTSYGYNYQFNISITRLDSEKTWCQGNPLPDPALTRIGYIRRVVLIQNGTIIPERKEEQYSQFPYIKIFSTNTPPSVEYSLNKTIPIRLNLTDVPLNAQRIIKDTPVEFRNFISGSLTINSTDRYAYLDLYGPVINITNFSSPANLQRIIAYTNRTDNIGVNFSDIQMGAVSLYIDGSSSITPFLWVYTNPFDLSPVSANIPVNKELKILVKKEFFTPKAFEPQDREDIKDITFLCVFDSDVVCLPNTPNDYYYSYNISTPTDPNGLFISGPGTNPCLIPAILEVWVW